MAVDSGEGCPIEGDGKVLRRGAESIFAAEPHGDCFAGVVVVLVLLVLVLALFVLVLVLVVLVVSSLYLLPTNRNDGNVPINEESRVMGSKLIRACSVSN